MESVSIRSLTHEGKEYSYKLTTVDSYNGGLMEYRAELEEKGMYLALLRDCIRDVAISSGHTKMILYVNYPPRVVERIVRVRKNKVKFKDLPLIYKGRPISYTSFMVKFVDVKLLII